MIITPKNGWSYDDSVGNWKLVYADKLIVLYEQTDQPFATEEMLFVGSEQDCESQIKLLDLKYPEETEEIEP